MGKDKLTPIEANRLLKKKFSLERKLLMLRERPNKGFEMTMKYGDGEKIGMLVSRKREVIRNAIIREIRIELKWTNHALGIKTEYKNL